MEECTLKKQIQKEYSIKKQTQPSLINAYILSNTYSRDLNQIIFDAKKLRNIVSIALVSVNRDIIVKTKVKNIKDLMIVSEKVKCIEGIKEVATHIIEKNRQQNFYIMIGFFLY